MPARCFRKSRWKYARRNSPFDLLLCDVGDPFVFDFAELFAGDLAIGGIAASIEDGFGAEEGSDVVGTINACWERHCELPGLYLELKMG
jgi:hypothetical protein